MTMPPDAAPGAPVIVTVDGQQIVIDASLLRDAIRNRDAVSYTPQHQGTEMRVNDEPVPDAAILAIGLGVGALMCAVLALLVGIPIVRLMMRRAVRRGARPTSDTTSPRLERIEHAVDAIAFEIERVAEAQRFSTRLLNERLSEITGPLPARAIPAERRAGAGGAAERVPTPH
jgi:hypothetical protein